jgi:ADP-heptose:LPS heptosyltransferase
MSEPMIRSLKKRYEEVYISTLVPDILGNHPDIKEILRKIHPDHLNWFDMFCLDNTYEKRFDLKLMVQDSYMYGLGLPPLEEDEKVPKIYLTDEEKAYAKTLLGEDNKWVIFYLSYPGGPGQRPYWEYKTWKPILGFLKGAGFKICIIGQGPSAEEIIEDDLIDLDVRGKTTMRQWLALQEAADLFLGNEGCPVIVAQAFGTPGVAIFNRKRPSSLFMNKEHHNLKIFHRIKGEKLVQHKFIMVLEKIIQGNYER